MLASGLEGTKKPRATGTDMKSYSHGHTQSPYRKFLEDLRLSEVLGTKGVGPWLSLESPWRL